MGQETPLGAAGTAAAGPLAAYPNATLPSAPLASAFVSSFEYFTSHANLIAGTLGSGAHEGAVTVLAHRAQLLLVLAVAVPLLAVALVWILRPRKEEAKTFKKGGKPFGVNKGKVLEPQAFRPFLLCKAGPDGAYAYGGAYGAVGTAGQSIDQEEGDRPPRGRPLKLGPTEATRPQEETDSDPDSYDCDAEQPWTDTSSSFSETESMTNVETVGGHPRRCSALTRGTGRELARHMFNAHKCDRRLTRSAPATPAPRFTPCG